MNPRAFLRGIVVIASFVLLGFLFKGTEWGGSFNEAWIDAEVRGRGLAGEFLFVAVGSLLTGIGVPRQLVSFLGGYAFGFVAGTGLAWVASVVGCIGAFWYARLLGRSVIAARFPGKVRKVDAFLSDHPFSMTLLIRLLPVGNNLLTNLTAAVTSVRALPFVVGSALGYLPQTGVFALAGSGVNLDPALRIGLSIALFVISGVLGVALYRRYRHGRTFDEALDHEVLADEETVR